MSGPISERAFEDAIECALLAGGPDACPGVVQEAHERRAGFGDAPPGGYHRRTPEEYDRASCLLPRDVIDFIVASQPKEWARLKEHHGAAVQEQFLQRLAREVEKRGVLDVLRGEVRDSGCKFRLAYYRPSSRKNPDEQRHYELNRFAVVRQLGYSERDEKKSLDLGLFLNGLPIFTAELKNPLTSQDVNEAIAQYKRDRDPREPLFAFGRCLAHFAVDPELVYVTTKLAGEATRFLPFNQGKFGGAGNPPVPPTRAGYATDYLWNDLWSRDTVLALVQRFMQEVEIEDSRGKKTGERALIFPRYHQLDCVRRLVTDARTQGPGRRYLIEHSAGSGKSNTIAWLAHQLSVLHGDDDERVFHSIIVVTDRRILDRQLQRTVRQFERTLGVVENIDTTSRQLKDALEGGKTIIVTTLHKFPVIAGQMAELSGKRFALVLDEAHSSQTGEASRKMKDVLVARTLEDAEREEAADDETDEDRLVAEIQRRGRLPNVSMFAFTATPKSKTLELFGTKRGDGRPEPFSLYSMRQAIEEGFILDVLEHYATYRAYWSLLKTAAEDPRVDKRKTQALLKWFVDHHAHAIEKKVGIIVAHFAEYVANQIGGRAKAMIVTRSRLHAVRYRLALDAALRSQGLPYKALVAFSGPVEDGGARYTEAGMNAKPEAQTALTFELPEYRFLVVANKFQTGFDQPLLHTMYVDKKLSGVAAVQTLSRLNRTHPGKSGTLVLDLANEAEDIQAAFQPYYEKTLLSGTTDPNLMYDRQRELLEFDVFTEAEVEAFAARWFRRRMAHAEVHRAFDAQVERFKALAEQPRERFRKALTGYVRLYAFLSQVIAFADPDMEKLYVFARLLARRLPEHEARLPQEVLDAVDMESYRVQRTDEGKLALERREGVLEPFGERPDREPPPQEMDALSAIIRELNVRFGTEFSDEDKVFIEQLETRLDGHEALAAAVRANPPENARLTFEHVVRDQFQELIETNFDFYKRVTDDETFAEVLLEALFARFVARVAGPKG